LTTSRSLGEDPPNTTPLSADDLNGLIPTFIASRADLDRAEQMNIEVATRWAFGDRPVAHSPVLFTRAFIDQIHIRMFGDVWRWAGRQRAGQTNIGVATHQIATQLQLLLDDALFWHVNKIYQEDELAVRLHHRLVSIHPYVNGNGRHSRFVADLYLHINQFERLTWGQLVEQSSEAEIRKAYIAALRRADDGDIESLLAFARS